LVKPLFETIDNETWWTTTHCEMVLLIIKPKTTNALDKIKNIVDKIGDYNTAGFSRES
jgi:hypothetical protein